MAISLGSLTPLRFSKVLEDSEDKSVKVVKQMLEPILMSVFNFKEDYASWLPNHLEHLNEGSLDILRSLNS